MVRTSEFRRGDANVLLEELTEVAVGIKALCIALNNPNTA
jgi:hypothetical protein